MKPRHFFFLGVGLALVITALVGALLFNSPYKYQGSLINPPAPAPDIDLIDQYGEPFKLSTRIGEDGRRKVAMIFFGFVHCPDVCPVTLSEYRQVKTSLGEKKDKIEFIFVTVDPDRDTPEILRKHLANFDGEFIGLTGSRAALEQVWNNYGVFVYQHEPTQANGYLVDHTARVYVVDRNGDLRMTYLFGSGAEMMAEDMWHLVDER
jgi:protein SCO1